MTPALRISPLRQFFKRKTSRLALAGIAAALGLLVVNMALTYRNTRQLNENFFWVAHSHEVLTGLEDVLSLAKDAETGQRGYLITGDPMYLEPYNLAVAKIEQEAARLGTLTADNPRQRELFDELQMRLDNRLRFLRESLEKMDDEGFEAARSMVMLGRGKQEMDELRNITAQMIDVERRLLNDRVSNTERAYRVAVASGVVTGVAALAALVALVAIGVADVQRRIREEEARRAHLAELAHASRLTTVGQMMAELGHELNQPLAAANNFARACLKAARSSGGADAGQLTDWIEKTAQQTDRAVEIVRRINAFTKKESGQRTPVNLNHLVENVIALTVPAVRSTMNGDAILTTVDFDRTIPEIYMDRVQIEQVLVNLIRNAIEAMQSPECHAKSLELTTRRVDHLVEVSVRDHGSGISAEDMTKLFQPYFTTKSSGMGLGLSICRSIVEQHEGVLAAEPLADGCRFRFTLPIGAGRG